MEDITITILRTIAHSHAKDVFDGCEPSGRSHGEDFQRLYDEFKAIENDKLESLFSSFEDKVNS